MEDVEICRVVKFGYCGFYFDGRFIIIGEDFIKWIIRIFYLIRGCLLRNSEIIDGVD